jgi:hypothetical protein
MQVQRLRFGVEMADDISADRRALRSLVNGFMTSQALHAFCQLGLADRIGAGRCSAEELAQATGANPRPLYRLLSALAAQGILDEDGHRAFALTPLGDGLRSDAIASLAGWTTLIGTENFWLNWGQLIDSVKTGETGWRRRHGVDAWTYREEHPEESAIFDRAMVSLTAAEAETVSAGYDFSRFPTIVDVGGGHGGLLAAILARNPTAMGVLFDQPHVVDKAAGLLRAAGVQDRCRTVSGSFFEAVPEGGDAYILKSVIHDWYEPEARAILETCRRAMAETAVLLLVERVLDPPNQGLDTKLSDLNMLVGPGGMERTREEYADLLGGAGFRLLGAASTGGPFSVLEAAPLSQYLP